MDANATTSTVTALLLGPAGALALMVLGGRWLMQRLEKADEVRAARDADFKTLVADNTKAMLSMQSCADRLAEKVAENTAAVNRLANGTSHAEPSNPGIRVVGGAEKRE